MPLTLKNEGMEIAQIKRTAWPILVLMFLQAPLLKAMAQSQASVTLAWNASAAADVAGYRVYEGTASHLYSSVLDVSTNTQATLSGLTVGSTYFFAVTAYAAGGIESPFSSEISYRVPPPAPVLQMTITPSPKAVLSVTAPAGYRFEVLVTEDLQNWSSIGSVTIDSTGSFQFTDPHPVAKTKRFYRLQQTAP